jgi:hypothetical protein
MSPRRFSEIAFVVPWIGVFLLTPPVILVIQNWSLVSGLPLFVIYLFVCWVGLIFAAWRLSRRFAMPESDSRPPPAGLREGDLED